MKWVFYEEKKKNHSATEDAKTNVSNEVPFCALCTTKENKIQETCLSSLESICLLKSRVCDAENY